MTDRLKIGQEVLIHGYVDEIRKDTIIIQNEGGYFGTVECEVTDIEMPDTNEVLNKIKAEIEAEMNDLYRQKSIDQRTLTIIHACQRHIAIIDEYTKAESDEQEKIDDYRDRLDELEREEYYESKYGKEQE